MKKNALIPPVPARIGAQAPFYQQLTPSAQTAFAQVVDHALIGAVHRTVANLSGTFARKTVAGKEYWYFQYRELRELDNKGKVQQVYLGPRSERLDRLIALKEAVRGAGVVPQGAEQLSMQARAAVALGNFAVVPQQLKILKRLDDYGYFSAGGVLVGTHAFACYGNMFGVAWGDFQMTHDLDFAYGGRSLSLALRSDVKLNVHDAVTSLEMGFLPSSKLGGLVGGTYVVPESPDFRLDFLTTMGREQADLVNIPDMNVAMVPLPFMEFSLEDIQQTAILSGDGAVLVNLPHPARFALHKLIVAGLRTGAFQSKVRKDVWQAAALLSYLTNYSQDSLADAWLDVQSRGKSWRSKFATGLSLMQTHLPSTRELVAQCEKLALSREADLAEEEVEQGATPPLAPR